METGVVIVTGASGLLGRETVRQFVESGWQVVAVGRGIDKLEQLRTEISSDDVSVVRADLTCATDTARLFGNVRPHYHAVAHLVGGYEQGDEAEVVRRMMLINFLPTMFVGQEAMRHIAGKGRMVFVSAAATQKRWGEIPHELGFYSSKLAVNAQIPELVEAGWERGVNVNAVLPKALAWAEEILGMKNGKEEDHDSLQKVAETIVTLCGQAESRNGQLITL